MPKSLDDGRYIPIPEFWRDPVHRALFIEPDENERSHQLTAAKARLMLHEGTVRGHPLTSAQRGLFGASASGQKLRKRQ